MDTVRQKRQPLLVFGGKPSSLRQCLLPFIEGVHFDLLYATPREVAYKCVAVALSNLSARGARAQRVLAQVSLRQESNEHLLMELEGGVNEAAKKFKVKAELAIGPVSPNGHLIQILASGTSVAARTASPKNGDLIAVTGPLGAAAAGLQCLRQLGRQAMVGHEAIADAYLRPACRTSEARFLAEKRLTAVDLQDGLASELNTMLGDANLGALVEEATLPLSPLAKKGAELLAVTPDRWLLYGPEDFELLFFCPSRRWKEIEKGLSKLGGRPAVIGRVRPVAAGVRLKPRSGPETSLPARLWNPLVRRRRA